MFNLLRKKEGTVPITDVQKIIIPKGLINPLETTVIEIPTNLQSTRVVIAKPKESSKPWSGPNTDIKSSLESSSSETESLFTSDDVKPIKTYTKETSSYPRCTKTKLYPGAPNVIAHKNKQGRCAEVEEVYRRAKFNPCEQAKKVSIIYPRQKPVRHKYMPIAKDDEFASDTSEKSNDKLRNTNLCGRLTNKTKSFSLNKAERHSDSSIISAANEYETNPHIKSVLRSIEVEEFNRIRKDLKEFQTARRKLILDTTNIHGRGLMK